MEEKVYVILESFTDCDGGNATSHGVFKTLEGAIEALPSTILEVLGYESKEEFEEHYECDFDSYFTNQDKKWWALDNDDYLREFYIQEDTIC